jgi:dTDP-4-amino-4,6-dideoxygalactose transaminase
MPGPFIGRDEKKRVLEVLDSRFFVQGTKVAKFEEEFAEYIGVDYAIAVNSGTAALHAALLASDIKQGDEIITTPFTFIATANSILYTGAKPVFADICEDDFTINPEEIKEKITKKTKGIIPVHLFGQPADMQAVMEIAHDHDLAVIEDACQAHGAEFKRKKVGGFATGCFSFYPTKNMTTGEGGMITTNNRRVARKASIIRNHGSTKKYYHETLGYNYRMTDIAAAMGIEQLKKLDSFNRKRIENARYLTRGLKKIDGIIPPKEKKERKHVFNQYTIRILPEFGKSREEVAHELNRIGIPVGIYYPIPIHQQPLYRKRGYRDNLPVSEKLSKEVLSLSVHPGISKRDIDHIIEAMRGMCGEEN